MNCLPHHMITSLLWTRIMQLDFVCFPSFWETVESVFACRPQHTKAGGVCVWRAALGTPHWGVNEVDFSAFFHHRFVLMLGTMLESWILMSSADRV